MLDVIKKVANEHKSLIFAVGRKNASDTKRADRITGRLNDRHGFYTESTNNGSNKNKRFCEICGSRLGGGRKRYCSFCRPTHRKEPFDY
jgi:hypothetical protein